jgi:hypothetical protein
MSPVGIQGVVSPAISKRLGSGRAGYMFQPSGGWKLIGKLPGVAGDGITFYSATGEVVIMGHKVTTGGNQYSTPWHLNPNTGAVEIGPAIPGFVGGNFISCVLGDGRLLCHFDTANQTQWYTYDPTLRIWAGPFAAATSRQEGILASLTNGNAVLLGGRNPGTLAYLAPVEVFDYATNTWSTDAATVPTPATLGITLGQGIAADWIGGAAFSWGQAGGKAVLTWVPGLCGVNLNYFDVAQNPQPSGLGFNAQTNQQAAFSGAGTIIWTGAIAGSAIIPVVGLPVTSELTGSETAIPFVVNAALNFASNCVNRWDGKILIPTVQKPRSFFDQETYLKTPLVYDGTLTPAFSFLDPLPHSFSTPIIAGHPTKARWIVAGGLALDSGSTAFTDGIYMLEA